MVVITRYRQIATGRLAKPTHKNRPLLGEKNPTKCITASRESRHSICRSYPPHVTSRGPDRTARGRRHCYSVGVGVTAAQSPLTNGMAAVDGVSCVRGAELMKYGHTGTHGTGFIK